ncbi:hypothetical protein QZH41_005466, partial [Actinostola sp. cb2023]
MIEDRDDLELTMEYHRYILLYAETWGPTGLLGRNLTVEYHRQTVVLQKEMSGPTALIARGEYHRHYTNKQMSTNTSNPTRFCPTPIQ